MLSTLLAVCTAQAATLDVGSGEDAYLTIGDAVSAASSGDTIRVGPGTYPEAIDLLGKAIAVESKDGAATTIITGNGSVTLNASSDETSAAVVSGFTLRGPGHTCIILNAASLQIRDSIVTDCGGDSTFIGGAAQINGGAPRFSNVVFSENQAVNGGAIRAAFGAEIDIEGSRFERNEAQAGGGLHLTDAMVTVIDSEFVENEALAGSGGAVWANEVTLVLSESSLVENTAAFDGGAVYATESAVSVDAMSAITGNSVSYGAGGALSIADSEGFTLSDSTLESNSAWTFGGAISIQEVESVTLSGVELDGNMLRFSSGGGGALAIRESTITLSSSTFADNTSEGHGGALFAVETDLEMSSVEFDSNETVGHGGAWYQLNGWSACAGCELTRNTSSDDGGAVWTNANDVVLSGTSVTWNETTGGDGGGVFFSGDRLQIEDSFFARNIGLMGGAVFSDAQEQFSSSFSVYQENETVFTAGGLWVGGATAPLINVRNNDFIANECLASDGVAQLLIDSPGADVRNNIVVFGRTGAGFGVSPDIGGTLFVYNDVYDNEGGNFLGLADPTGEDGNQSTDPLLVALSVDRNFLNDNLYLQVESPLAEAGDPELTTADGRRSFIGAFDRIDIEDTDLDGDGFTAVLGADCDDADSTTYPGAPERCDDAVDNDCDGVVNEDCEDTGDSDTGGMDTGIDDLEQDDTGATDVDEPDAPDEDDRTPPAGTPSDAQDDAPYKVSGEGCSCSVQNTSSRSGILWLLTPLMIWVRRR